MVTNHDPILRQGKGPELLLILHIHMALGANSKERDYSFQLEDNLLKDFSEKKADYLPFK